MVCHGMDVVWLGRKVLDIRYDYSTRVLHSLGKQRLDSLERFILPGQTQFYNVLPFLARLNPHSRLSTLYLSLDNCACETMLLLCNAQVRLRALSIITQEVDCYPLQLATGWDMRYLASSLRSLRLVSLAGDSVPASEPFLAWLAQTLPDLQTLAICVETWYSPSWKNFPALTQLYVLPPKGSFSTELPCDTLEATRDTVAKLVANTPPQVGVHLLVYYPIHNTFKTILEQAIGDGMSHDILKTIVQEGNYRLDFCHSHGFSPIKQVTIFDYIPHQPEWWKFLFDTLELPFILLIHSEIARHQVSIFEKACHTNQGLQDWMEPYWRRAMKRHLVVHLLLSPPTHENPEGLSILFELASHYTLIKHRFDVLTGIADNLSQFRDRMDRTLLFDSSIVNLPYLLEKGLDWRHTDAVGLNVLQYKASIVQHPAVRKILTLLSDEDFKRWFIPEVVFCLSIDAFEDRMKALVPVERWKDCCKASIHWSLATGRDIPLLSNDPEIRRVQVEAWYDSFEGGRFLTALAPSQPHLVNRGLDGRGQEIVHLLFWHNKTQAQIVLSAIATLLGTMEASHWLDRRNATGQTYLELYKTVFPSSNPKPLTLIGDSL